MRRLILALLFALLPATADAQLILYGRNSYPLLCDGTNCTLQSGQLRLPDGTAAAPSIAWEANTGIYQSGANEVALSIAGAARHIFTATSYLFQSDTAAIYLGASNDVVLLRGAANTLAQRNGTAAQTFRGYGTFTDASNYERWSLSATAGSGITLAAQTAGTGGDNLNITLTPAGTGGVIFGADNTYDIGASGATRPRTVYAGTSINAAGATAFVASGANAQAANIKQITELHTLAAAGSSDTTIQFPANALVLGVSARVTTEITGCIDWAMGDAVSATRYGSGLALTVGTTRASAGNANPHIPSAAQSIRFTCSGGGGSFTAGVIRVTGYYIDLTAPTS